MTASHNDAYQCKLFSVVFILFMVKMKHEITKKDKKIKIKVMSRMHQILHF